MENIPPSPVGSALFSSYVFSSPISAAINTSVSAGNFNITLSATTVDNGYVKLNYDFPSFNLATTGTEFALHVVNATDDFTVQWLLNGVPVVNTTWSAGSNFDVFEPFSYFNPAALAAATSLTLDISAPNRTPDTSFSGTFSSLQTQAVPEPATFSLMALGLAGLGWSRRQRG